MKYLDSTMSGMSTMVDWLLKYGVFAMAPMAGVADVLS